MSTSGRRYSFKSNGKVSAVYTVPFLADGNSPAFCRGHVLGAVSDSPCQALLIQGCPDRPSGTFQCSRISRWPGHTVKLSWQLWFTGQDANQRSLKAVRIFHNASVCSQGDLWGLCVTSLLKVYPEPNHMCLKFLFSCLMGSLSL